MQALRSSATTGEDSSIRPADHAGSTALGKNWRGQLNSPCRPYRLYGPRQELDLSNWTVPFALQTGQVFVTSERQEGEVVRVCYLYENDPFVFVQNHQIHLPSARLQLFFYAININVRRGIFEHLSRREIANIKTLCLVVVVVVVVVVIVVFYGSPPDNPILTYLSIQSFLFQI